MGYDQTKDEEITKEELERGHYKLIVSLHSYDGGQIKLQLGRVNFSEKGEQYAKLGRLSKEDLLQLLPVIEKMIPQMNKQENDTEEEPVM